MPGNVQIIQMFCQMLHYTGCRPSEAVQRALVVAESSLVFLSRKKRKVDSRGRQKQPQFRTVPAPPVLIEHLDLVFDLRPRHKRGRDLDHPLCSMSRPTA